MVATSFKYGLDETSAIFDELMLHPSTNISRLMETIEKFAQLEEIKSERTLSKTSKNHKASIRDYSGKKQVNTVKIGSNKGWKKD